LKKFSTKYGGEILSVIQDKQEDELAISNDELNITIEDESDDELDISDDGFGMESIAFEKSDGSYEDFDSDEIEDRYSTSDDEPLSTRSITFSKDVGTSSIYQAIQYGTSPSA
jgi:hypothetical protein